MSKVKSPTPILKAAMLATSLLISAARAEKDAEFGRIGFAIKSGECAGPMGSQVSWNFNRHWQASAGVGGVNILSDAFSLGLELPQTESYYLLGRYYLKHAFLSTGYSIRVAQNRSLDTGYVEHVDRIVTHALPIHLGYEFGTRQGLFMSVSTGYLWVPVGGGRKKTELRENGDVVTVVEGEDSGLSLGISLGFYLF